MASNKVLLLLFGASFLPGFLSDPQQQPYNFYTINSYEAFDATDPHSFDVVPLTGYKARHKRQVTIPPESSTDGDEKGIPVLGQPLPIGTKKPFLPDIKKAPNIASVWLNKTQTNVSNNKTSSPLNTKESKNDTTMSTGTNRLLGNPNNHFVNNAENETEEAHGFDTLDFPEFPPELNETLKNYNISQDSVQEDNFKYYVIKYEPNGSTYWKNLTNSSIHDMLSNAHRRAATLKPKFEFPFYGHLITNVTVATGGFIYLGDQVHAWLAATQYVAPLMANFDTASSENATVSYDSKDDYFAVEWAGVTLQDSLEKTSFSFQTTLYENGTIVFAYKDIPIPIKQINDTHHPVKIGLSDAYIRDRNGNGKKHKTIYEYHRIDLKEHYTFDISAGSVVIFSPQKTCLDFKKCEECTAANITFDCAWCPSLQKCSDGYDRGRQDWIQQNCDKDAIQSQNGHHCSILNYNSTPSTHHDHSMEKSSSSSVETGKDHYTQETSQISKVKAPDAEGASAGGVITILFLIMVVLASVGWLFYAYLYPHTASGQLLIRYRPSQWAFRRGEARYTAASIHM